MTEYGDYECPYSRQAFRAIERVERELSGHVRFAFRHFPLTQIHPHALAAASAAEAAARQERFWEMHSLLFHRQKALEVEDLRTHAHQVGLDVARFDRDRADDSAIARIARWNAPLYVDVRGLTTRRLHHDDTTFVGQARPSAPDTPYSTSAAV